MSNHLAFKAFVKRFVKRFPEPQYRYVSMARNRGYCDTNPKVSTESINAYLKSPWNRFFSLTDPIAREVCIYHRATDALVCSIKGNLSGDIQLQVASHFLPRGLFKLFPQVQRPKFAKLGAGLAAHIYSEHKKAQAK